MTKVADVIKAKKRERAEVEAKRTENIQLLKEMRGFYVKQAADLEQFVLKLKSPLNPDGQAEFDHLIAVGKKEIRRIDTKIWKASGGKVS